MISFIKGTVDGIEEDKIVVECGNIGYNIFVPGSVVEKIGRTGTEVKIYTYLSVREDAMVLFGFLTRDDLNLFKMLITVNGVGPKAGLNIMSTYNSEELRIAILSGDAKAISKAPGIGAKTASKIILELKDKIDVKTAFAVEDEVGETGVSIDGGVKQDALDALMALGYSPSSAMKAVNAAIKTMPDVDDVSEVIKIALKNI